MITVIRKMTDKIQNTVTRTTAVLSDGDTTVLSDGDAAVVALSSDDDDELAAMHKGIIQWYKVM